MGRSVSVLRLAPSSDGISGAVGVLHGNYCGRVPISWRTSRRHGERRRRVLWRDAAAALRRCIPSPYRCRPDRRPSIHIYAYSGRRLERRTRPSSIATFILVLPCGCHSRAGQSRRITSSRPEPIRRSSDLDMKEPKPGWMAADLVVGELRQPSPIVLQGACYAARAVPDRAGWMGSFRNCAARSEAASRDRSVRDHKVGLLRRRLDGQDQCHGLGCRRLHLCHRRNRIGGLSLGFAASTVRRGRSIMC